MNKIQVWGDSILKGVIYDETKQKYVILKHTALNDATENTSCEICNYSKFGQTVLHARPKLEAHLKDDSRPDMILIEMGGNDCDFNWKEVGDAPEEEHIPNTPLDVYARTVSEFVDRIRENGIVPVLTTLPPLDPQRYFDWSHGEMFPAKAF
jgi:lysophospholipase L1-like esterase